MTAERVLVGYRVRDGGTYFADVGEWTEEKPEPMPKKKARSAVRYFQDFYENHTVRVVAVYRKRKKPKAERKSLGELFHDAQTRFYESRNYATVKWPALDPTHNLAKEAGALAVAEEVCAELKKRIRGCGAGNVAPQEIDAYLCELRGGAK